MIAVGGFTAEGTLISASTEGGGGGNENEDEGRKDLCVFTCHNAVKPY